MEYDPKASAAAARMAAMTANANAVHARLAADAAAAYARRLEIDAKAKAYGFSHEDVLRALDAAGMPKFSAGDMLAKEHPGEAIVPKTCTLRIGGAAGGGGGCGGGQPATFNPWPEALALGREIVRLNERIALLLDRWDGDGVPAVRGQ
ncbi:hypothetical protein [Delftia tsuruhatensis]|uniref:hypothetical protein n=1 Tax=Delftia tsuruhatensis TaxID=180282 RepID=UPI00226099F2|nr:hypothetical protein [Delftia tsuruhatensis]MCX7509408.1 hypothetical protein [Delftia tsuruhatensis]